MIGGAEFDGTKKQVQPAGIEEGGGFGLTDVFEPLLEIGPLSSRIISEPQGERFGAICGARGSYDSSYILHPLCGSMTGKAKYKLVLNQVEYVHTERSLLTYNCECMALMSLLHTTKSLYIYT